MVRAPTYRLELLLMGVVLAAATGCRGAGSEQPSGTTTSVAPDKATSGEEVQDEPEAESTLAPSPTPVPSHLQAFRGQLELGRVGLALNDADALLAAHPDDPWVLADVGYAKATFKKSRDQGEELLRTALEAATDSSLRAQILYYQARLAQRRDGLMQARQLVADAVAVFPLQAGVRNLELLDGAAEGFEVWTSSGIEQACARRMPKDSKPSEHHTCVGVAVGPTEWVRLTRVLDDSAATLRVFHDWYLATPTPENPEGLRFDFGGPDDEPAEDLPICRGAEELQIDGSWGGEGAVLDASMFTRDSEQYLVVRCRGDEVWEAEGATSRMLSSIYVRVCSLERGWCTRKLFEREALHDGTVREAAVEIRDGEVVVTPAGEGSQLIALP